MVHTGSNSIMDTSWTDALPVCDHSGVGRANNQVYKPDGQRVEGHEVEDRMFRFKTDDDIYLYGIFDGHKGSRASNFAAQRIPAELLLGQLSTDAPDEEVKANLLQAFMCVENVFMESIGDELAERASLKMQLPDGVSDFEICKEYPEVAEKLNKLEEGMQSGTTGVVALIMENKLFVANIGDCRALLCKFNAEGKLIVTQLSVDHTWDSNTDEQLRLRQLGVGEGVLDLTRTLGDYHLKGGYKENAKLMKALGEPVTAQPDIHGGVPLDDSCRFLILMSAGLVRCWEDGTESEHPNADIAGMVVQEFGSQHTLFGVTQAVVDHIVRVHHDKAMSTGSSHVRLSGHDDITLLVRNFRQPLGGAQQPGGPRSLPSPGASLVRTPYYSGTSQPHYLPYPTPHATNTSATDYSLRSTLSDGTATNSSTGSVEAGGTPSVLPSMTSRLPLDQSGRIKPYVDFSPFYEAVKASGDQLDVTLHEMTSGSSEEMDEAAAAAAAAEASAAAVEDKMEQLVISNDGDAPLTRTETGRSVTPSSDVEVDDNGFVITGSQ